MEEGKAYRPRSEMTRKSKERKGRGGGGGDGGAAVKGVGGGGSQSLSGSHSSLGRAGEDSLNLPGEDLLMVRRYRTRGRSLGPGTGNRVNVMMLSIDDLSFPSHKQTFSAEGVLGGSGRFIFPKATRVKQ